VSDPHKTKAAEIFETPVAEVTAEQRQFAILATYFDRYGGSAERITKLTMPKHMEEALKGGVPTGTICKFSSLVGRPRSVLSEFMTDQFLYVSLEHNIEEVRGQFLKAVRLKERPEGSPGEYSYIGGLISDAFKECRK
jgi:hypothetical protein